MGVTQTIQSGSLHLIALDPGYATGVAEGFLRDDEPLVLHDAGVIVYEDWPEGWLFLTEHRPDKLIVEKFTLRDNDFKADLTPVKIEGTIDLGFTEDELIWRDPSTKEQVPDELLKEIGWWKTGADVDWEDGRDANDAIIHLLGYVAFDLKHKPTLKEYFK